MGDVVSRLAGAITAEPSTEGAGRALSALRVLLGSGVLWQALMTARDLPLLIGDYGLMQRPINAAVAPRGLPSIDWLRNLWESGLVAEQYVVYGLFALYAISAFYFTAGYRPRLFAAATLFFHLLFKASGFASTYGAHELATNGLFFFAFLPTSDALDIRMARVVLRCYLTVVYVSSGLEKLSGAAWREGAAMWIFLMRPEVTLADFGWVSRMPWLASGLCWLTIAIEAGYVVCLFVPRLRTTWFAATTLMHLGIAVTFHLWFFSATMIALNCGALVTIPARRMTRKSLMFLAMRMRNLGRASARPTPWWRLGAIVLLSLVSSGVAADVRCVVQETPRQCMRRLIAARAYENAQADLAAVPTGSSAVSSPIRSALKDFLSVVSAHLDTSTLNDDGKALLLDYNLPGTLLGARRQVKLQAVLTDPKLSDVVIAELAADPARASSLQRSLTNADDLSVSLTFNPVTRRFGRGLDPHRALFDSMMLALVEGAAPATVTVPAASFDVPFAEIVPDAAGLMTAMAEFETAAIAVMPAVATRVTADLTRLVSNQPQLYVSGTYRYRKPVVGPVERGIRATWEIGTDNLNRFRRAEGRDCEARGTCLAAFNDYTNRTAAEHRSDRLALAVEYHAIASSDPALTTPSTFVSGKSHKFTYSLDYGREITSFFSGRRGRIDFALDYDGKTRTQNVTTGDAMSAMVPAATEELQVVPPSATRWSAATTVTQPVWGGLSVLLSVVWADRMTWFPGPLLPPVVISPTLPPRRGEPFSTTQRTVVAHVGVRYMVPPFSRPSPPSRPCECCCR